MKKIFCLSVCFISALVLATTPGMAQKPDSVIELSNGFPSGAHFNLNIISKDPANFVCPAATYEGGVQVFGNVIYIPESTDESAVSGSVKIMIESGAKGPKSAPTITELQVTDWCAGFGADDTATIRIPANAEGYRAFARVLGKPSKDPLSLGITVYQPELYYVQDENGIDLLDLGLVTSTSVLTPEVFIRYTGKSIARNISPLFQFSGTVTYLTPTAPDATTPPAYCCTAPDAEGLRQCTANLSLICAVDPYLVPFYVSTETTYTAEWMFNIADFVAALWGLDPSGAKLLQVRLYPEQNVTVLP